MFYNAYNMKDNNNLCLSVAYSEHPAGPFVSPDGFENSDGKMLSAGEPVYDFTEKNLSLAELAKTTSGLVKKQALDASPFIDPQTNEKYMYFSYYNDYGEGSSIYGVKMKDWFTPDYSTLTRLSYPGYLTVESGTNRVNADKVSEGGVNEGPFMFCHNGKYYLTMSVFGYTEPNYRVIQAIADSPLVEFKKIDEMDGGKVVSSDTGSWSHIVSAGHHCFIQCGDEIFIAYHTFKDRNSIAGGRALAVDKVVWTKNSEGVEVMHTNGPTWSVQPLPESVSGYKNIAPSAVVTADNTADDSDAGFLTDELIKYQEHDLAKEYTAKSGVSTIKLEWDDVKTVRSVMIYNSYDYNNTFVNIENIKFEYVKDNNSTGIAEINNLEFDWDWHFEPDFEFMRPGGAAIAEFNEMPVKSITITVRSAEGADKLTLGEIVVLGKDEACAGVSEFTEYSYENAAYGSSNVIVESENFGSVPEAGVKTYWGYDLSHDDGTDNAYILQKGCYDQYAYLNDVYSTDFYAEAEITVTTDTPYANDPFPKFGIAMSCGGDYPNTIFYYVDAVNYTNTIVGCAQRRLDNSDWDWDATEQLVNVPNIKYTDENYVKLGVLRRGSEFYLLCNDSLVIYYDNFNIFTDSQKAAVGFLSFNTPMKIRNYSATTEPEVIEEMTNKYAGSLSGGMFGEVSSFSSTTGWDFSNDNGEAPFAVQNTNGEQYAYFKDINSTSYYVETDITVTQDLGDPFPKFGLAARNNNNTLFFYIDGSGNYTTQRVGYLSFNEKGEWLWGNPDYNGEQEVALGNYKDGETVKLGMLRDGETFKLYVDDKQIFTVTDLYGFGSEDNACVSVFSFTTGVTISNYSATTDIADVG